jgi:hypothetical protein
VSPLPYRKPPTTPLPRAAPKTRRMNPRSLNCFVYLCMTWAALVVIECTVPTLLHYPTSLSSVSISLPATAPPHVALPTNAELPLHRSGHPHDSSRLTLVTRFLPLCPSLPIVLVILVPCGWSTSSRTLVTMHHHACFLHLFGSAAGAQTSGSDARTSLRPRER